jgi:hypothetical protein
MSVAKVPETGRAALALAAVDRKQIHSLATGEQPASMLIGPVPSNEVAQLFGLGRSFKPAFYTTFTVPCIRLKAVREAV